MLKGRPPVTNMAVICLAVVLSGCASPRTEGDVRVDVNAAEATLADFQRDPEMKWLQQNMKNAKAVLVSPNILKAGFIAGGSGGRGVVFASGTGNRPWNGPAFYNVATVSIGLQAGVQSSEMVAMFMTEKAMNSLLSSSFKLGADVSVAAGPVGIGTGAPITGDVVVFSRSKGLYGGANLDGTVITIDEKGNRAFYGRPVSPVDILVKGTSPSSGFKEHGMPTLEAVAAQK